MALVAVVIGDIMAHMGGAQNYGPLFGSLI